MKLSPLDCKILDLLDRDSRLSADRLARDLKVSGDTILYHLSKLRSEGTLERCTALIDLSALGLILFRTSISLTTTAKIDLIARRVFKIPQYFLVVECRGEHDLIIWGAASSLHEIQSAFSYCQEAIGRIVRESSLEIITETLTYSRGYFINRPGKIFPTRGDTPRVKLDPLDIKILQLLREDSRQGPTSIAFKLKTTPAIVSYRTKKMERCGVISGYRTHVDSERIGMQRFRVQVEFRGKSQECSKTLRKFCEVTPVITRLEFQIGKWSAEIGIETESFGMMHQVIDQVKKLGKGRLQVVGVVFFRATRSAPEENWRYILQQEVA